MSCLSEIPAPHPHPHNPESESNQNPQKPQEVLSHPLTLVQLAAAVHENLNQQAAGHHFAVVCAWD